MPPPPRVDNIENVVRGNADTVIQVGRISGVFVLAQTRRRLTIPIAAVIVIVAFLAGGDDAGPFSGPGTNAPLVAAGRLTVCTDRRAPVGIDFDLIDLVARRLGVTRRLVDTKIDDGAALNARRCDITTGQVIYESRKAVMDFSAGYFFDRLGLVVRKGARLRKLDQFTGTNGTLGVVHGGRGDAKARQMNLSPIVFGDEETLFQALLNFRVDAVLHDLITVNERLQGAAVSSGFERSDAIDLDVWYGLAVRKGNAELLKVVNDTFAEAVQGGVWGDLYTKWVHSEPPAFALPR